MQIYGPSHLHGPHPINAPHGHRPAQPAERTGATQITDEVEISPAARQAEASQSAGEVRQDRVQSIRAQIAEGTYETPEKLEIAVARLLDEIG